MAEWTVRIPKLLRAIGVRLRFQRMTVGLFPSHHSVLIQLHLQFLMLFLKLSITAHALRGHPFEKAGSMMLITVDVDSVGRMNS